MRVVVGFVVVCELVVPVVVDSDDVVVVVAVAAAVTSDTIHTSNVRQNYFMNIITTEQL